MSARKSNTLSDSGAGEEEVVIAMTQDKICKNSVRFKSDGDEALTNVYLGNDAVKQLGEPESIVVTITAG
jgi:hypothetical protein